MNVCYAFGQAWQGCETSLKRMVKVREWVGKGQEVEGKGGWMVAWLVGWQMHTNIKQLFHELLSEMLNVMMNYWITYMN